MKHLESVEFLDSRIYSIIPTDTPASDWPCELAVRNENLRASEDYESFELTKDGFAGKYQLEIDNLEDDDLLLFTSFSSENGIHPTEGYVVTEHGVALPGDVIEANPGKYTTSALREKVELIGCDELLQFNLTALAAYIHKNSASQNYYFLKRPDTLE